MRPLRQFTAEGGATASQIAGAAWAVAAVRRALGPLGRVRARAMLDLLVVGRDLVLRTALPGLVQIDCPTIDDLMALPSPPAAHRLVVLVGPESGLPYRQQSQLGLEALHASRTGMLDAFATRYDPPRRRR